MAGTLAVLGPATAELYCVNLEPRELATIGTSERIMVDEFHPGGSGGLFLGLHGLKSTSFPSQRSPPYI